jgi:glycosyltransferase involved in cell wall biosynthesis
LPRDVPFVPFGKICRDIPSASHVQLLATFLVQLQPRIIHNVNSAEGYLAFREHGAALRQGSQLFASVFCEDITEEGRIVGYAFDQLPDCFRFLSGVFADNSRILDVLHSMFGFPREQLHLHYQPIESSSIALSRPPDERLSVLWAGRLDRQKRPDLLKSIALRLGDSPIDFTVYGSTVLGQGDWAQQWELSPNIVYRGPFDRLDSLPLTEFDVFLHTAEWEGMPNVLLEALSAGLPVVASAVGGVPELIEDYVTGIGVSPHDDINAYCSALRALHADRSSRAKMASAGRAVVNERHSWSAFCEAVRQVPDYAVLSTAAPARGQLEMAHRAA